MEKLDKETEELAVDAVKEAIALESTGTDPSQAIAKVASSHGFTPPIVQRVVEAYNATKSISHFQNTSGEEKVASFPLADASKVMAIMYPSEPVEKEASAPEEDYAIDAAPAMEKAASLDEVSWEYAPDVGMIIKRAYGELARLKKKAALDNEKHGQIFYDLRTELDKLAQYCRSMDRVSFHSMERTARGHFGDDIVPMLDIVWGMSKAAKFGEQRFTDEAPECIAPVDEAPYNAIDKITFLAKMAGVAEKGAAHSQAASSQYESQLQSLVSRTVEKSASDITDIDKKKDLSKQADIVGDIASEYTKEITPADKQKMTQDYETDLLTSDLMDERRAIDAQLMLYDFIKNDEILRRADPNTLITTYNEISRLAPYTASNPALMRSLLRRAVEARGLDPFELKNVTELENVQQRQHKYVPGKATA